MLFLRFGVLELFQLFIHVAGYLKMDTLVAVVPFNDDDNVSCVYPIGCDALVLLNGLF